MSAATETASETGSSTSPAAAGATASRPPSERRQQSYIWLLAAWMATLAALIAVPQVLADPAVAVPDLRWLALLPLFALAEVVVIHLPTHRNAHGHTLREVPAVLGLTFLASEQYVTAYVVGAVLGLVVAARMRGIKLVFNSAMFAFEAALGALTYHLILGGGDPLSVTGWAAALAAVLVTDLISAGAVTAAISLTEHAFDGEVLHEALRAGVPAAFINTCVAILVATLVLVQPSALPLLGVVVVILVLGYRVYISLARGHARTQLLYRFVDRTSAATSADQLVELVLAEAAELMHAERAYLVERDEDHEEVRCHVLVDGGLQARDLPAQPEAWWWAAFDTAVVQYREQDGPGEVVGPAADSALLAPPRDGLAAPLRAAGATHYVLVVCDRSFEKETFDDEDVQVFGALAAHAGVAMERARSVSDLQALAQELEVARDAALAASEAKSMFLANISHEIRTPLTGVIVAGELLSETSLEPVQRNLLDRMRRSGGQLQALVESLLDFSRIEAGHAELHPTEFDLRALVQDIVETQLPRAQRQGVRLEWEADERAPHTVIGDRVRVFQVLNNLVDNALKFTSDGRVRVDVRPAEGLVPGGLQFAVTDTGIGIREEDRDSIFESFRQVDGTATRRYQGTGLGLAICRELVELMGGTIAVDGEFGVGSTFTVRLPLPSAEAGPSLADLGAAALPV